MTPVPKNKAKAAIDAAKNIFVTAHVRPDGDAIGSVLGLGLALQAAGKKVTMGLNDGVPSHFNFLEGHDKIVTNHGGGFDLVIVLDTGSLDRAGVIVQGLEVGINIDHHPTNTLYGEINLVEAQAVATCEILARLIPEWDLPMTPAVVEALMTGIIMDSQGFRTINMRPDTLRAAAILMEKGANISEVYFKALTRKSFEAMRYWGEGLTALQRDENVVWASLSLNSRRAANYPGRDDGDLVNLLARIEGADVVMMFIEQSSDKVKVSWRAKAGYNVAEIAQYFGGGGHIAAAGATLEGGLQEVQQLVVDKTLEVVQKKEALFDVESGD